MSKFLFYLIVSIIPFCSNSLAAENIEHTQMQLVAENRFRTIDTYDDNTIINLVKNSYPDGFPKSQGYKSIGESFDKFFQKPVWKVRDKSKMGATLFFTGFATLNGNKCLVDMRFDVAILQTNGNLWWTFKVWVNKNQISKEDHNQLISNIMIGALDFQGNESSRSSSQSIDNSQTISTFGQVDCYKATCNIGIYAYREGQANGVDLLKVCPEGSYCLIKANIDSLKNITNVVSAKKVTPLIKELKPLNEDHEIVDGLYKFATCMADISSIQADHISDGTNPYFSLDKKQFKTFCTNNRLKKGDLIYIKFERVPGPEDEIYRVLLLHHIDNI